jgi:ribonuclease HI
MLRYVARLQFSNGADKCTNNVAEYEAILMGLQKFRAIGVQTCILHKNSKVISSQIEKECDAREPTLKKYLALDRRMENHFKGFTLEYIERIKYSKVDKLVKATARNMPLSVDVFFQVIADSSVKIVESDPRLINLIEGEDWRATIMAYLRHYYEPDNTIEHIRMQQRAKAY